MLEMGQLEYVGVWHGTAYNPVPEQTDPWPHITANGRPIRPGYTIAIDRKHWAFGQRFYIEGIGIVEAQDIGSKVNGPERFDWLIGDYDFAIQMGRFYRNVWLITN